jgi:hypothetical protein
VDANEDNSGDSYTTTSFNLTDGSPLPTPGNPLGNPTYPGWTSAKYAQRNKRGCVIVPHG